MSFSIKIFEDYFTINNKSFNCSPNISELEEILGESRTRDPIVTEAKSTIYTFDDFGIWAHVENGIAKQISLLYSEPYIDFHPQKTFSGELFIKEIQIFETDNFLSVPCEQTWDYEWEAEGSLTIEFIGVHCGLTGDAETKEIEDICFWFA